MLVWKTISVGNGQPRTFNELCDGLQCINMRVSDWAVTVFYSAARKVIEEVVEMSLCRIRAKDLCLGPDFRVRQKYIWQRARDFGLGLIPHPCKTAFFLRQNYVDQPRGETLILGMEPVRTLDGTLNLLSLHCDDSGKLEVCGTEGDPEAFRDPGEEWIFLESIRQRQ
jgi:hypothetical protein